MGSMYAVVFATVCETSAFQAQEYFSESTSVKTRPIFLQCILWRICYSNIEQVYKLELSWTMPFCRSARPRQAGVARLVISVEASVSSYFASNVQTGLSIVVLYIVVHILSYDHLSASITSTPSRIATLSRVADNSCDRLISILWGKVQPSAYS